MVSEQGIRGVVSALARICYRSLLYPIPAGLPGKVGARPVSLSETLPSRVQKMSES